MKHNSQNHQAYNSLKTGVKLPTYSWWRIGNISINEVCSGCLSGYACGRHGLGRSLIFTLIN